MFISLEACKSIPRDECSSSRSRPLSSADERRALLNSEERAFSGLVLETYSKRPLMGATAYIEDLRVSQVSDSLGIVRFTQLPVGRHSVQVRRLGFEALTASILVSPDSGTAAVFQLSLPKSVGCQTVITS